jgi:hypothetical protein
MLSGSETSFRAFLISLSCADCANIWQKMPGCDTQNGHILGYRIMDSDEQIARANERLKTSRVGVSSSGGVVGSG